MSKNQNSIRDSCAFSRKIFAALLFASTPAVGCPILAQTPVDSMVDADSPSSQVTLKATVRRVDLDIVVTDFKGNLVNGLTREDFSVAEDKVPQALRSFDVHTIGTDASFVPSNIPPLPSNTFLNVPKSREAGTPTVILYDAMNTSLRAQAYGEQQFLRFLKRRRAGRPVAIFVLSDRLHLVQAFTEQLSVPDVQKSLKYFTGVGRRRSGSLDRRVAATLGALTEMGRFLASMPGRKNLIWYSSGFPESILPHESGVAGGGAPAIGSDVFAPPNYSEPIHQATDLLNLSHVAIYPVDVRGVRADPTYSAELRGEAGEDFGTGPQVLLTMRRDFIEMDNAERGTMDTLADNTGGHAFYGTNDLAEALDRAMSDGSTYYSLTYEPTNPKYDGSLRHIRVTLKKPGYSLAYRNTYYADDLTAAAHAAADAPESPLTPTLERGMPLAHGLFVEAHLDADGPPVPATPEQMQVLSQYAALQAKEKSPSKTLPVMMQQYVISYGLIARQLELAADDTGAYQASLEFGIIAYDDDGRKLNGTDTRLVDTIPASRYGKLTSDGYHVVQSVAVPVTAASIRLAVRDIRGNRAGSLEVQLPLAKAGDAKLGETKKPAK